MNLDKMKEEVVSLMEDYFDQLIEERMDVVGQNGNDGLHYVDYGAGPREVEHVVNEKEYWAKLKELPDDEI